MTHVPTSYIITFYVVIPCLSVFKIAFHWWFDIIDATYSVEQSKQRTGSQAAAWRRHVSQFDPDIPPGIISLHGGQ